MSYTKEQFGQWEKFVDILRSEMPVPSFNAWIKPLKLISVTSDNVLVLCENHITQTGLTSRYSGMLDNAIKRVFGANYSIAFNESIPNDNTQPNESRSIIFDFIRKQNVSCTHAVHDVYRYIANFPVGNRIRTCVIILAKETSTDNTKLHVVIELPIHIKRGEADHVIKELTVINDELESNQCYDVDILEGTVRFRTIVGYPEDIKGLDSIVSESMKIVEEDFIDIMQLIVCELAALEKAAK